CIFKAILAGRDNPTNALTKQVDIPIVLTICCNCAVVIIIVPFLSYHGRAT
ncbi:hypothetical protein LCGC14_2516340, partial [marine sediment metagenome]